MRLAEDQHPVQALAAHGADVLLITASHLPSLEPLVIDTGRGKSSAYIDLRQASGREAFAALLRDADVFVQGYRPGAISGAAAKIAGTSDDGNS